MHDSLGVRWVVGLFAGVVWSWSCVGHTLSAGEPQPSQVVAAQVDELVSAELARRGETLAPPVSDEEFLRRAMLDLSGVPPTVSQVVAFSLEPGSDKRVELIRRQLQSEEYARNWARYWRDVIYSRATDARTTRFQGVFERWMTEQLRDGRHWNDIVTELITATGDAQENGATALLVAHGGNAQEIAAETSRIFLGIQIQCANCHDHPTDQWKRADFHELAAYFPRVVFRQVMDGDRRTFEVSSMAPTPARFAGQMANRGVDPERLLRGLDRNGDGKITREEAAGSPLAAAFERFLAIGDKDGDNALSADEIKALPTMPMPQFPGRGSPEYLMPDLNDPSSRGTRVDPVFFVSKSKAPAELGDIERRYLLASEIVDPSNEWFARAYVNRIWTELIGAGFYMPIDDIGPERTAEFAAVLDLLADQFVAHDHDMRWLFETLAQTGIYQRSLRAGTSAGFAASIPVRLRGDAVYEALARALGFEADQNSGFGLRQPGNFRGTRLPRGQVTQTFGFDPSTPQDDLTGTIPQALFLMNSPIVEQAIQAEGRGVLARVLRRFSKDEDVVRELYLTVLSREPSAEETSTARNYLAEVSDRNEAFEDLYWALLNSSEFLNRR